VTLGVGLRGILPAVLLSLTVSKSPRYTSIRCRLRRGAGSNPVRARCETFYLTRFPRATSRRSTWSPQIAVGDVVVPRRNVNAGEFMTCTGRQEPSSVPMRRTFFPRNLRSRFCLVLGHRQKRRSGGSAVVSAPARPGNIQAGLNCYRRCPLSTGYSTWSSAIIENKRWQVSVVVFGFLLQPVDTRDVLSHDCM
jgi:hypothetical protein